MEEADTRLEAVRRAAARGAFSTTKLRQVVEDAVDQAVSQWGKLVMRGGGPKDLAKWAFRVGVNAAKAIGRRTVPAYVKAEDEDSEPSVLLEDAEESRALIADLDLNAARRVLRAQLARQKNNLAGRQFEVANKMTEPGMTLHRAAKELGMDRRSLKRSFRSALVRLRRRQCAPLPPPTCRLPEA